MPRKRQIDPDIWTNEQFVSIQDFGARLLFVGMISHADDEGRLKGSPRHLKLTIFPADNIGIETIKEWRDQIAREGLIRIYQNNTSEYIVLPTFTKHQYITKRNPSKLPCPPKNITTPAPVSNHSVTTPAPVSNLSVTTHGKVWTNGTGTGTGNEVGIGTEVDTDNEVGIGTGTEVDTDNEVGIGAGTEVEGEIANTTTTTTFLSFLTWENAVGRPITGFEGQELSSLIDTHSDTWVTDAIQEAARLGKDKVRLRYIERILERWQSEGRVSTEYSTSKASHSHKEADISPSEYIKKYGHLTKRPEE